METPKVPAQTRDQSTQYIARTRKERRAGLSFPVTRIRRYMQARDLACRISSKAAVTVASTLEYLCSEIVELAGDECIDEGNARIIKPRHVTFAVKKDEEIYSVVGESAVFPTSHGIPYINPVSLGKKKAKY